MEEKKAIPPGHMTVGELAKRMGVTVRTLQYYDKQGLLSPSSISEGGRRLYTDKDMVKLHQILSLKHLGFALEDIKNRLIPLESPDEVAQALAGQAEAIRMKIDDLRETLREVEALREEVVCMQEVDFRKYADIIVNLQMKNEYYWLIKHFDGRTLEHIRTRFDRDSGMAFFENFQKLQEEAISLQEKGVDAAGAEGQDFARRYWEMIEEFTQKDDSMLTDLMQMGKSEDLEPSWRKKQELANAFIGPALDHYFAAEGIQPFQEGRDE